MKKLFFFAIICILISCKKENSGGITRSQVAGTWELESSNAAFTGIQNYPPGNGSILFMSSNGDFQRRQHDTVTYNGAYSLQHKKDCFERESETLFSTSDGGELYIDVKDGKLSLSTGNCVSDGGIAYYRRLP